ncbi:Serine/threonine-protein kinase HT1 [Leucoagaricus sp. SymC.cos]|nr:Serine/threonine-protein kinase HT1 [Leucoagaricus sp. SymC.cos]
MLCIHQQSVVIFDEGRALIATLGADFSFLQGMIRLSWNAYIKRFMPLVTWSRNPDKRDIWAFGCLSYQSSRKALSGKLPHYQFPNEDIEIKHNEGELLTRPDGANDQIDDKGWGADVLREPFSGFIKNPTKDIAAAVIELAQDDILTMVNFLDQVLKETLSISDDRNHVLAILSKIRQGPRRYTDEGGCGIVHQVADPTVCTKATLKLLDTGALMVPINQRGYPMDSFVTSKFFTSSRGISQGSVESPQTCLVSPFMKNRNLRVYAARLPQKSRLPLISDVANGLQYLHALGVVHGDLKELHEGNVFISDEGRGPITDFGAFISRQFSGSLSFTTLRFSAPETVLGNRHPTRQFDIWSLRCLCYVNFQTTRSSNDDDDEEKDEFDWDDDIKDQVFENWSWDDRPATKVAPGTDILKLRVEQKIDLRGVEELLGIHERLISTLNALGQRMWEETSV